VQRPCPWPAGQDVHQFRLKSAVVRDLDPGISVSTGDKNGGLVERSRTNLGNAGWVVSTNFSSLIEGGRKCFVTASTQAQQQADHAKARTLGPDGNHPREPFQAGWPASGTCLDS